jgi:hypothetical protein
MFILPCIGNGLAMGGFPSEESCQLSTRCIISELILNGNWPTAYSIKVEEE